MRLIYICVPGTWCSAHKFIPAKLTYINYLQPVATTQGSQGHKQSTLSMQPEKKNTQRFKTLKITKLPGPDNVFSRNF